MSSDPHDTAKARTICAACPVRKPCTDYGANEPGGTWGGRTETQREMAGQIHPETKRCTQCKTELDPASNAAMHPDCQKEFLAGIRGQNRAEVSAGRTCARCDVAIWAQARSCLVCGHIVGQPLPEREWKW